MTTFYGQDLAAVHAEAFEMLAEAAATSLLRALDPGPPAPRVLDLGCGAGPLSRRLSAAGISTWGLDQSPDLIALARKRMPDAVFECGSIIDAKLPPAEAVAAVGEVINYATADEAQFLDTIFDRIFEALAPGGMFLFDLAEPGRGGSGRSYVETDDWAVGVVSTEHKSQLVRRITTFRKTADASWTRSYEEHHLRLWPSSIVMERLRQCGFELQDASAYEGIRLPPKLRVYRAVRPD